MASAVESASASAATSPCGLIAGCSSALSPPNTATAVRTTSSGVARSAGAGAPTGASIVGAAADTTALGGGATVNGAAPPPNRAHAPRNSRGRQSGTRTGRGPGRASARKAVRKITWEF